MYRFISPQAQEVNVFYPDHPFIRLRNRGYRTSLEAWRHRTFAHHCFNDVTVIPYFVEMPKPMQCLLPQDIVAAVYAGAADTVATHVKMRIKVIGGEEHYESGMKWLGMQVALAGFQPGEWSAEYDDRLDRANVLAPLFSEAEVEHFMKELELPVERH